MRHLINYASSSLKFDTILCCKRLEWQFVGSSLPSSIISDHRYDSRFLKHALLCFAWDVRYRIQGLKEGINDAHGTRES